MKPDVVEVYAALRRDHPARPLPRDMEEWMILEVVRLRDQVQAERAAIVAFLRARIERHERALRAERQAADAGDFTYSKFTEAKELLSIIERGEHRREEEK